MTIAVRAQPENARSPIDATPSGMTTDARESHVSKALSPIDVTPSGMTTDVRPVFLNAPPFD